GGARVRQLPVDPRRGARGDRRGGHRGGPGLRRRIGEVRARTRIDGPEDRLVPGDLVQDRAHAGPGVHGPVRLSRRGAPHAGREATQVDGGYGFMNEYPVPRHYRDSKILEIGEGTTEVQLMLIARGLGL